jgi:single-strand DNA-binding protein
MLNRIVLIGRLTKGPELKYIPSGDAVANFVLAVDRSFLTKEGQREADFIPVVVWRKQAERCAEHLVKGNLVAIDGRLQMRSYDQEGQRKYVAEVVAEEVKFLEWRKKKEG